uniref:DUF4371 domain-containing protein n=1 Tax=Lactuca sativa TaxID=4236 RepID=A0A9R1VQC0_LACSA|nr:hypothetical protein LSAT_V11C400185410 [Lactuca sativa]
MAKETIKAIVKDMGDELFVILVYKSRDVSCKEKMALVLLFVNIQGVVKRFVVIKHVKCGLSPHRILGQGDIQSGTSLNQEVGIKRPCDTRGGSHFGSLLNVNKTCSSICKVLEDIKFNINCQDHRAEARRPRF